MSDKNDCRCSECGRITEKKRIFQIDGDNICARCLYGDAEPFEIYPIGIVRNNLNRSRTGFGTSGPQGESRIELFPSQERFLYKIEDEKSLTVVYFLNKRKPVKSVFHRGLDGKKTGVFATRTPDRLSGIAIQDVRLIRVEGTTLCVEGLDAIDKTPVLDIKMCWSNIADK
ncbi:MAG TPA: TrmO family methyltransferase [bacterium]|nr:TrmO family methyltransferase [bacterium]